jgi:dienelactone hydrolase
MHRLIRTAAAGAAVLLAGVAAGAAGAPSAPSCHVGLYAFDDGSTIDIAPSSDELLRWRRPDGTSGAFALAGAQAGASRLGWTSRPDGHDVQAPDCAKLRFDGATGRRVPLVTREIRFGSDGIELVGRLVLPPGEARVPVVVLLHGSEHDSALTFDALQRRLPSQGIGAFVFDKRGTGASGGRYTQDFEQLARDAVAALAAARRLGGERIARIGFEGPSQGGWVAPIAATRADVDFVTVVFGLAVSVIEEDRSAVAKNMADRHHSATDTARAMALVDAADALALDPTLETYDRFAAVRDPLRGEPWFKDVRGDFAWAILPVRREEVLALAKQIDWHTPFLFDPLATIAAVKPPQLWVLAEDDVDAPSAETARRLAQLRMAGHSITTAMWPRTEHGIFEYETAADGTRTSLRQPEGYLALLADFARGAPLKPLYGGAALSRPQAPARP